MIWLQINPVSTSTKIDSRHPKIFAAPSIYHSPDAVTPSAGTFVYSIIIGLDSVSTIFGMMQLDQW